MFTEQELLSRAIYQRRSSVLGRAPELTASMRHDLASSPLDWTHLEETGRLFGAAEDDFGYGISTVFDEYLSREGRTVPVRDVKKLQQNLIDEGYAGGTNLSADGQWAQEWNPLLSRFEKDARDMQRGGAHVGATPVQQAFMWLGYTLPPFVWQGTVGTAKGLVAQAGETAENLGALGGAIAGAPLGVPGMVGGAVLGFLADLFGDDQEENDDTNAFLDALTPFEEYGGPEGGRQFLDDLAFVGSAASLLWGAGAAVKGIRSGAALMGETRGALAAASELGAPAATFESAALGGAVRTAVAEGGIASRFPVGSSLRAGLARSPVPPDWSTPILKGAEAMAKASTPARAGPYALNEIVGVGQAGRLLRLRGWAHSSSLWGLTRRPFFAAPRGAFTALSKGSIGARLAQTVTSGGRASELEKSVAREPIPTLGPQIDIPFLPTINLPGGLGPMDLGALGDPLMALGFLMYPDGFFPNPVTFRGMAQGARNYLGSDRMRWTGYMPDPATASRPMTTRERQNHFMEKLTEEDGELGAVAGLQHMDREFGTEMESARLADETGAQGLDGEETHHRILRQQIRDQNAYRDAQLVREELFPKYSGPRREGLPASLTTDLDKTSDTILRRTIENNGGGTFDARRPGVPLVNKDGHYAGIGSAYHGDNAIMTGGWGEKTAVDQLTDQDFIDFRGTMRRFVEKHKGELEHADVYVGTFRGDDGVIHLDPGLYFGKNVADAERAAIAWGQWGGWSIKDGVGGELKVWDKGAQEVARGKKSLETAATYPLTDPHNPFKGPEMQAAWAQSKGMTLDDFPVWQRSEKLRTRIQQGIEAGDIEAHVINPDGTKQRVRAMGAGQARFREIERQTSEESALLKQEWDALEKQVATRQKQLSTSGMVDRKPVIDEMVQAEVRMEQISMQLKELGKTEKQVSRARRFVLALERRDSPTRNDLNALADELDLAHTKFRQAVSGSTKAAKAELKGKVRTGPLGRKARGGADAATTTPNVAAQEHWGMRYRQALQRAIDIEAIPSYMDENALRWLEKPSARPAAVIRRRAELYARDAELPQDLMDTLAETPYKPVFAGEAMAMPDIKAAAGAVHAYDFSPKGRGRALMDTLANTVAFKSNASIWRLRMAAQEGELKQVLAEHPEFKAPAAMVSRRLADYLDKSNSEGSVRGAFVIPQNDRIHLARMDVRELNLPQIQKALEGIEGYSDEFGIKVLAALKRGAAFGAEMDFRSPGDTSRLIGRAMRLNGLSGFVDVMRTAHVRDPGKVVREVTEKRIRLDMRFRDAEMVGGPAREQVAQALKGATQDTAIAPERFEVMMGFLDQRVSREVELGIYPSHEVAWKAERVRVEEVISEAYATGGQAERSRLIERFKTEITDDHFKRMRGMALGNIEYGQKWFTEDQQTFNRLFGHSETRLGDRPAPVRDDDLFTQIVAVTSIGQGTDTNLLAAQRVFNAIKGQNRKELSSVIEDLPLAYKETLTPLLEDIFEGRTIDTWNQYRVIHKPTGQRYYDVDAGGAEALRSAGVGAGKPLSINKGRGGAVTRPKVTAFYQSMRGNPNVVTVDTRMKIMWGMDDAGRIADDVIRMADDLSKEVGAKVYPRDVQAALWGRYDEEMGVRVRETLDAMEKAEKDGNTFAVEELQKDLDDLEVQAERYLNNKNFTENYLDPTDNLKEEFLRGVHKGLYPNIFSMRDQVENMIRGTYHYGPEFGSMVTLARTGNLKTFFHEQMHAVRRVMLTPDEANILERHYGVGVNPASDELRGLSRRYTDRAGMDHDPLAVEEYAVLDEARAKRIADAYDNLEHAPQDPAVKKAYAAFTSETRTQYDDLVAAGYTFEPWAGKGQPYKNSEEFARDLRENKHLYYYKTKGEEFDLQGMDADNPLLADTGRVVKDSAGNDYAQTDNDLFRAVHDVYGHGKEGFQTGPRGEENAWRQHARMYSPDARRAMTTETRGQNSWVNFNKKVRGRDIPLKDRPFADQKIGLLPEEFTVIDSVPDQRRWTTDMEEDFAAKGADHIMDGVQAPKDIRGPMKSLRLSMRGLWRTTRNPIRDTMGGVPPVIRELLDDRFDFVPLHDAAVLPYLYKIKGVPEGKRALGPGRLQLPVTGAVTGAALGAFYGDDKDSDTFLSMLGGAGAGLLLRKFARHNYGYMTDSLVRLNSTLRYTLSFTFDLGRQMEQRMIATTKYGLPIYGSPKKYMNNPGRQWKTPYSDHTVSGEQAMSHAYTLFDELNGLHQPYFQVIDDIDRRAFQRGLTGFSPREHEAAQALLLYQRGWSKERIREAVSEIGRYGLGRTNLEKSANFIIFPFSFQKKMLTTIHDWVFQAPGRNLLLYEGLKRFEESTLDEGINDFIEKHVPLLKMMWTVNNLASGLSPGRFFLDGLTDNRTAAAKAAQVLASVMVPSGAATPLAQLAGGVTDYAINAFVPIVTTGESIDAVGGVDNFFDLFQRYIPFVRDLNQLWTGDETNPGLLEEQVTAMTQGESAGWQQQHYLQERRALRDQYEPVATGLGYAGTDSLFQSDIGAVFKEQFDSDEAELRADYPSGFEMAQSIENRVALNDQALMDLREKSDHTPAEERIIDIAEAIDSTKFLFRETLQLPPEFMTAMLQSTVRSLARQFVNDERFREMYDRFFAYEFGPVEITYA